MIKTERLIIKSYSETDRADMLALLTEPKIKETYMIPDFQSDEDADNMFEKLLRWSHSAEHFEKGIYFENRLIGFINDVEIDGKNSIELGYVIHPNFWNRGFAAEALSVAIKILFACGFRAVCAAAFVENPASIRVMEKCGMMKTERTEKIMYREKEHECVYYTIENNC